MTACQGVGDDPVEDGKEVGGPAANSASASFEAGSSRPAKIAAVVVAAGDRRQPRSGGSITLYARADANSAASSDSSAADSTASSASKYPIFESMPSIRNGRADCTRPPFAGNLAGGLLKTAPGVASTVGGASIGRGARLDRVGPAVVSGIAGFDSGASLRAGSVADCTKPSFAGNLAGGLLKTAPGVASTVGGASIGHGARLDRVGPAVVSGIAGFDSGASLRAGSVADVASGRSVTGVASGKGSTRSRAAAKAGPVAPVPDSTIAATAAMMRARKTSTRVVERPAGAARTRAAITAGVIKRSGIRSLSTLPGAPAVSIGEETVPPRV